MERGKRKSKKGKFILIGLGTVAVGTLSFFGYRYYQKQKQKKLSATLRNDETSFAKSVMPTIVQPPRTTSNYTPSYSAPSIGTGFPLKIKSRGALVGKVQAALNKRFGTNIDVDNIFGPQTQNALKSKGFPTTIDQATYDKIVTGKSGSSTSSSSKPKPKVSQSEATALVSKGLKKAIYLNDLNKAIKTLGYIRNKTAYTRVNNEFKKTPPTGHYTRKTLVTALLGQFSDSGDKRQLEKEFKRMGLKKSGSKWTLSGIGSGELITIAPASVWNSEGRTIDVPRYTILGEFITGSDGVTEFETLDGKQLYIATEAIKYRSK